MGCSCGIEEAVVELTCGIRESVVGTQGSIVDFTPELQPAVKSVEVWECVATGNSNVLRKEWLPPPLLS